ncbi:hypothetical protein C3L33_09541, partial [Rhododendron williamsianum]
MCRLTSYKSIPVHQAHVIEIHEVITITADCEFRKGDGRRAAAAAAVELAATVTGGACSVARLVEFATCSSPKPAGAGNRFDAPGASEKPPPPRTAPLFPANVPGQIVAKSMEKVISNSIAIPNDPRRKELEKLEKQKTIDKKAQQQVQTELLGGLGFVVLQTLGFMRLTFWELSWDVMEPIGFFVTSLSFPLACGFFLRTSKEPTFEGFFRRRFKVKQKKLMETHKFDSEKYNELCRAFYPNYDCGVRKYEDFSGLDLGGGSVFGAVHR